MSRTNMSGKASSFLESAMRPTATTTSARRTELQSKIQDKALRFRTSDADQHRSFFIMLLRGHQSSPMIGLTIEHNRFATSAVALRARERDVWTDALHHLEEGLVRRNLESDPRTPELHLECCVPVGDKLSAFGWRHEALEVETLRHPGVRTGSQHRIKQRGRPAAIDRSLRREVPDDGRNVQQSIHILGDDADIVAAEVNEFIDKRHVLVAAAAVMQVPL